MEDIPYVTSNEAHFTGMHAFEEQSNDIRNSDDKNFLEVKETHENPIQDYMEQDNVGSNDRSTSSSKNVVDGLEKATSFSFDGIQMLSVVIKHVGVLRRLYT